MGLIRKPGRKVWTFQCKVSGRTWSRSTGETDRARAEAKIPGLRRLAELYRKQPQNSLRLKKAIVREVDRIQIDVSEAEATRMAYALTNFFGFVGDVPLEKITSDILEQYQRRRLIKASLSTVNREVYGIMRLLKLNGFMIQKPQPKRGKRTKHRPFTDDEFPVVTQC